MIQDSQHSFPKGKACLTNLLQWGNSTRGQRADYGWHISGLLTWHPQHPSLHWRGAFAGGVWWVS